MNSSQPFSEEKYRFQVSKIRSQSAISVEYFSVQMSYFFPVFVTACFEKRVVKKDKKYQFALGPKAQFF